MKHKNKPFYQKLLFNLGHKYPHWKKIHCAVALQCIGDGEKKDCAFLVCSPVQLFPLLLFVYCTLQLLTLTTLLDTLFEWDPVKSVFSSCSQNVSIAHICRKWMNSSFICTLSPLLVLSHTQFNYVLFLRICMFIELKNDLIWLNFYGHRIKIRQPYNFTIFTNSFTGISVWILIWWLGFFPKMCSRDKYMRFSLIISWSSVWLYLAVAKLRQFRTVQTAQISFPKAWKKS